MLSWLYKETCDYLERLERAVQQGRGVDEASHFARWLQFSGLYKIFEAYPQPPPLEVNGKKIRELGERVVAACGVIYKGGKLPLNPSQSTTDEINAKLDILLSNFAKPISQPVPQTVAADGQTPPALPVMPGWV